MNWNDRIIPEDDKKREQFKNYQETARKLGKGLWLSDYDTSGIISPQKEIVKPGNQEQKCTEGISVQI